jgi:hypothetical protein
MLAAAVAVQILEMVALTVLGLEMVKVVLVAAATAALEMMAEAVTVYKRQVMAKRIKAAAAVVINKQEEEMEEAVS